MRHPRRAPCGGRSGAAAPAVASRPEASVTREQARLRRLLPPPSRGYRVTADGGLYVRRGGVETRLRLEVYDPTEQAPVLPLFGAPRGRG